MLMYIPPEAPAKTNITGAWKRILKNWQAPGMIGTNRLMDIGVHIY